MTASTTLWARTMFPDTPRLWALVTRSVGLALIAAVAACSTLAPESAADPDAPPQAAADDTPSLNHSSWALASRLQGASAPPDWTHKTVIGQQATRYSAQFHEGRPAVHALAQASNSVMRTWVNVPSEQLGQLRFSWFVPALNPDADVSQRDSDDAVARVMLTFEGDRSRLSARDHLLSELAMLLSGEPLPYATLMYVWDPRHPAGDVVPNARTARIRSLVVESGPKRLGRWIDFERDIRADYEKAFGEPPGALVKLALMSDSNNTGRTVQAWFGPMTLRTPMATASAAVRVPGAAITP